MDADARALLARLTVEQEQCSAAQHALARRAGVLRQASLMLRTGRSPGAVLALIAEQAPDLAEELGEDLRCRLG